MKVGLTVGLPALCLLVACGAAVVDADTGNGAVVGDMLQVPENYRTQYQYLGSWSVAAGAEPGAKEMHIVYASPRSIDGFLKDGSFPDDAVLVKEIFETTTESMTTGTVSRAANLKGWFMMVKDSKSKHVDTKHWGDGWGWSWFDAANPTKTTTMDYKSECIPCHMPAQGTDWIYTQGYQVLKH